jgi:hypothetical protein
MLRGQERCGKRATLQAIVRIALSSQHTSVISSVEIIKKLIVGGNLSPLNFLRRKYTHQLILLSTTNKMQSYTIFFIVVNALHVSGGFFAHLYSS